MRSFPCLLKRNRRQRLWESSPVRLSPAAVQCRWHCVSLRTGLLSAVTVLKLPRPMSACIAQWECNIRSFFRLPRHSFRPRAANIPTITPRSIAKPRQPPTVTPQLMLLADGARGCTFLGAVGGGRACV